MNEQQPTQVVSVPNVAPPAPSKRRRRRWALLAGALVVGVAGVGVVAVKGTATGGGAGLKTVYGFCRDRSERRLDRHDKMDREALDAARDQFSGDDDSITVKGAYVDISELSDIGEMYDWLKDINRYVESGLDCVLDKTDAPTRVKNHINETRALDGQQEESWGGVRARWTYHPDDGLDITLWES